MPREDTDWFDKAFDDDSAKPATPGKSDDLDDDDDLDEDDEATSDDADGESEEGEEPSEDESEEGEAEPAPLDLSLDPITGRKLQPNQIAAQLNQFKTTVLPAMQREIASYKSRAEKAEADLAGFTDVKNQITQHGLNPQETSIALRLAATLKTDPAKAAKEVLDAVKASGVELPSDIGGSVNYAALAKVVNDQLQQQFGPLLQHINSVKQEQEGDAKLEQEMTKFFDDNPLAEVNKNVIADVLEQAPHLGLHGAWKQIQLYAKANGLDLVNGLKKPAAAQRNPQGRSLGSPRTMAPQQVISTDDNDQFDPNESWDSIYEKQMKKAGVI